MTAARNSTRARRICFDAHKQQDGMGVYLLCHICDRRISPGRDDWDADHIRRHAEGGEETSENLWPAHAACHRTKSAKDVGEVAKGKRVAAKHYGIKRGPKKGRPMPFGRKSALKKKIGGEVVRRER